MKDKQLNVDLKLVMEKRRLDQALSIKEFAIAAGISYSVARNWIRSPGFPTFRNVVFWQDFVEWRRRRMGMPQEPSNPVPNISTYQKWAENLPPRAAKIMADMEIKSPNVVTRERKQAARV